MRAILILHQLLWLKSWIFVKLILSGPPLVVFEMCWPPIEIFRCWWQSCYQCYQQQQQHKVQQMRRMLRAHHGQVWITFHPVNPSRQSSSPGLWCVCPTVPGMKSVCSVLNVILPWSTAATTETANCSAGSTMRGQCRTSLHVSPISHL